MSLYGSVLAVSIHREEWMLLGTKLQVSDSSAHKNVHKGFGKIQTGRGHIFTVNFVTC